MKTVMGITLLGESVTITATIAALAASTAFLLIFVILLFACKPFRNLFFRTDEKPKKKKSNKANAQNAQKKSDADANDNFENDCAVAKKITKVKKTKGDGQTPKTRVRLAYSDSVPTVPLFVAPKTTGKTHDEDIMKRTHEALMEMSYGNTKPRDNYADTNANDYVPTIVIPKTNTRDKTANGTTTGERKNLTTNERLALNVKTGERTLTTHERLAASIKTGERTAPRPAQTTNKPTAKTGATTATTTKQTTAKTTQTTTAKKPTVKTTDKK